MDITLVLRVLGVGILVAVSTQILSKTGRDEQATFVTISGVIVVFVLLVLHLLSSFYTVTLTKNMVVQVVAHIVVDVNKFGIIYAGAQKNMGPAGLTVAIVRDDLIGNAMDITPTMFNYQTHSENGSMFNTPPTYAIYICSLVCKWLENLGGLDAMKAINEEKAEIIYDYLDNSSMFSATVADKADRSLMNVPFVTGDADLDAKFVKEAKAAGFENLKGHRSVGGMRASIYNAMPQEGIEKLVEFMKKFEKENA